MFSIKRYGDEEENLDKNMSSNREKILELIKKSAKKKKASKRTLNDGLTLSREFGVKKTKKKAVVTKKVEVVGKKKFDDKEQEVDENADNNAKKKKLMNTFDKVENDDDDESLSEVTTETSDNYDPLEVLKMRLKAPKGTGYNFDMLKVDQKLPEWIENACWLDTDIDSADSFDFTCLEKLIQENLKEMGINRLFPVQSSLIPALLFSIKCYLMSRPNDICVCSPTGSGKTLAFAIPIINYLLGSPRDGTRALVVVPTVELAKQVHGVFVALSKGSKIKSVLLGSGQIESEIQLLSKKSKFGFEIYPDVIVTTPGRLAHFLEVPGILCFKELRFLVIDEADRILNLIKQSWLQKLKQHLPESEQTSAENTSLEDLTSPKRSVQKLLFSATLNTDPQRLKTLNLFQPRLFFAKSASENNNVAPTSQYMTPPTLHEHTVICETNMKPLIVIGLLMTLKVKKVLCFTGAAEATRRLHLLISEYLKTDTVDKMECMEFSSLLTKRDRKRTMADFSSKKDCILVCSDAMARGIDAEDVELVILYDSPLYIETYIHRAGRASRAGKEGSVYTLMNSSEVSRCKKLFRKANRRLPDEFIVDKDIISKLSDNYEEILCNVQKFIQNPKKHE